jgi:hypothetical protein
MLSTIMVLNNNDTGPDSLRAAIAKASTTETDTIAFSPALSGETITLSKEITVAKSLNINTLNPVPMILKGDGHDRVFYMDGGTHKDTTIKLQDLTIENGKPAFDGSTGDCYGGGIYNNGTTLTINDCSIVDNTATAKAGAPGTKGDNAFGGGVYNRSGSLTIESSTIYGNKAQGGDGGAGNAQTGLAGGQGGSGHGGGIDSFNGTAVTLDGVFVTVNTARGGNGGTVPNAPCAVNGVNGGSGGNGRGGGIYVENTPLTIKGTSSVSSNHALGGDGQKGGNGGQGNSGSFPGATGGRGGNGGGGFGGGIYLASHATLTVSWLSILGNDATGGTGQKGGDGGLGGFPSAVGVPPGPGGHGGDGGNGGLAAGGGIYVSLTSKGTVTVGSISSNVAAVGTIGGPGFPGMGVGNLGPGKPGTVKKPVGGGIWGTKRLTVKGTTEVGNTPADDPGLVAVDPGT